MMLRTITSLFLVACGAPSASTVPCKITWTGALTGEGSCEGASSDALMALQTGGTPDSLSWSVDAKTDAYTVTFEVNTPNPPADNTYTGGTTDQQSCMAQMISSGTEPRHVANSRPSPTDGSVRGSCSVTFTTKTEDSSKLTKRYLVHGTATATLENVNDATKTVTMTVTF